LNNIAPLTTDEQNLIALHSTGHALVCAAPGSGKTTTMRKHIVEVLKVGPKTTILALMFNKQVQVKFEAELRRDLRAIGGTIVAPTVKTFHGHAYGLLRKYIANGLLLEYRLVADEANPNGKAEGSSAGFWRKFAREALAKAEQKSIYAVGQDELDTFESFLTLQKAILKTPEDVFQDIVEADLAMKLVSDRDRVQAKAYGIYENARHQQLLWSFDDLITDLVIAARYDRTIALDMGKHFSVVIADEFQDVNAAQMEMLDRLAANARLMAVGDDDQSIYGFRGSSPSFMVKDFESHFPGSKRFFLSKTFRFGPKISAMAKEVIVKNKVRISKDLISAPSTPDTTVSLNLHEDYGTVAARLMRQSMDEHKSCACLVRSYYQTALVEIACVMQGVPYRIEGSPPFYARREALAIMGWLFFGSDRLSFEDVRSVSTGQIKGLDPGAMFRSLLGLPGRFLPTSTLDNAAEAIRGGVPWKEWVQKAIGASARSTDRSGAKRMENLEELTQDLLWVKQWRDKAPAHQMISILASRLKISDSLDKYLPKEQTEDRMRFIGALAQYAKIVDLDVDGFVKHIAGLAMKSEMASGQIADEVGEKPLITSYHRAKGLEWDTVILPDLQQGSVPYMSQGSIDFEEERRLFFVAKTRAKKHLHLISPIDDHLSRIVTGSGYDKLPGDTGNASQFLKDIRSWKNVEVFGLRKIEQKPTPDSQ
jgi:DNA helicase-2/ATP-dependent DNA helicase PcrA